MSLESSQFDIRQMNSNAISLQTPREIGQGLLPFLDLIIQGLPDNDESLELRLRAVVNILVISKLAAEHDRQDLDRAKQIITSETEKVINGSVQRIKNLSVITIDKWTNIHMDSCLGYDTHSLGSNLSELIDRVGPTDHYILDCSNLKIIDLQFAGFLIGLQKMLHDWDRKMSLVWLSKDIITPVVMNALVDKFNLYKKGAFLLSTTK